MGNLINKARALHWSYAFKRKGTYRLIVGKGLRIIGKTDTLSSYKDPDLFRKISIHLAAKAAEK